MSAENFERTFSVADQSRLIVSNLRGSITIHSGPEGTITVHAVKRAEDLPLGEDATELRVEQEEDGTVVVKVKAESILGSLFGLRRPAAYDITIYAPETCDLRVKTVSAPALLDGPRRGAVEINSVSGEVRIVEHTGDIEIQSVSGHIHGERLSGMLELNTVSGAAHLAACNLAAIDASTVSGRVSIATPLHAGPYNFKSVSGGIHLELPADAAATIQLKSISGRIRVADSAQVTMQTNLSRPGNRHQVVALNGGGPAIQASTVSGSLHLALVGEAPLAAANEASSLAANPPAESRLDILEKVSRGEMSVEDAVGYLETVK